MVYIVRAIIEDRSVKDGFVLIQESKSHCYGKWYLPSGNVHRGEGIDEAVKRVVHEEAGLADGNPEQIILIEEIGPFWWRFTFLVTFPDSFNLAKNLKTEKQKDKYSIKAEIWEWEEIISTDKLRDEDMLRCVREYNKQMSYWKKRDENIRQGKMKYGLSHHASQIENDLNWMKLEIQNIPRDFITIKALFVFETKEQLQLVTVLAYCR